MLGFTDGRFWVASATVELQGVDTHDLTRTEHAGFSRIFCNRLDYNVCLHGK